MARHERHEKSPRGELGVVLAVGASGRLTVRAASSKVVPEGTPVVDPSGSIPGEVVRVFGPVARPYYSVRIERTPRPREAAALIGAPLIVEEVRHRGPG